MGTGTFNLQTEKKYVNKGKRSKGGGGNFKIPLVYFYSINS